jgi:hypothetical protein
MQKRKKVHRVVRKALLYPGKIMMTCKKIGEKISDIDVGMKLDLQAYKLKINK